MQLLLFALVGKLAALYVGFQNLSKLSSPYKFILLQIIVAIACEIFGYYLGHVLHQQNIWLYNWYWLLGETGLMGIAGLLLLEKKNLKIASAMLLLATVVIWLYTVFAFSLKHYSPLLNTSVHITLVIIYTMLLVDRLLFSNLKLIQQPDFWLCLSVLLYFGCNIPLYGLFNYLNEVSPQTLKKLFEISLVLNFIRYPLVAVSFYLIGRQKTSTQS